MLNAKHTLCDLSGMPVSGLCRRNIPASAYIGGRTTRRNVHTYYYLMCTMNMVVSCTLLSTAPGVPYWEYDMYAMAMSHCLLYMEITGRFFPDTPRLPLYLAYRIHLISTVQSFGSFRGLLWGTHTRVLTRLYEANIRQKTTLWRDKPVSSLLHTSLCLCFGADRYSQIIYLWWHKLTRLSILVAFHILNYTEQCTKLEHMPWRSFPPCSKPMYGQRSKFDA